MKRKIALIALFTIVALAGTALIAGASTAGTQSGVHTGITGTEPRMAGAPKAGSNPAGHTAPMVPVGSGFTYQGRLTTGGSPANGQYDITFTLFDALAAGNQVSTPITMTNQTVTGGLFTVTLDFGAAFQGSALWLDIAVRSTGGGSFTTLSPRQALTPAPYALGLVPGAVVDGSTGPGGILFNVSNTGGNAMAGYTGSATDSAIYGVNSHITSTLGVGVKGQGYYYATGVEGGSSGGYGVYGHSSISPGVRGTSSNAAGGDFASTLGNGLFATSTYSDAIHGQTQSSHAGVSGTNLGNAGGVGTYGESTSADGVYGFSHASNFAGVAGVHDGAVAGNGVFGASPSGTGVFGVGGVNGVYGYYTGTYGYGVRGDANAGAGVYGYNSGSSGLGVYGSSVNGVGLYGSSVNGVGVQGVVSNTLYGIQGANSGNGAGLYGTSTNGIGVQGVVSNASYGVQGVNSGSGNGVRGTGTSGVGVYGVSTSSIGVYGISTSGVGVLAQGGTSGDGVQAFTSAVGHSGVAGISSSATGGNGVYGTSAVCASCYAGYFDGRIRATGGCCTGPELNTQMDDPLDPANKYLNQSAVQSADMKNMDDGVTTLDAAGEAWISLPVWFGTLTKDFRYQLTAIGAPSPNLYVSQEITDSRFKIAGGKPGSKVSWLVTGLRDDPYAISHAGSAEQNKPAAERGLYLNPELYGQPVSKSVSPRITAPEASQPAATGGK